MLVSSPNFYLNTLFKNIQFSRHTFFKRLNITYVVIKPFPWIVSDQLHKNIKNLFQGYLVNNKTLLTV